MSAESERLGKKAQRSKLPLQNRHKQIFKDFMVILPELKMFLEPEPWPNSAKPKCLKLKHVQYNARQMQVL